MDFDVWPTFDRPWVWALALVIPWSWWIALRRRAGLDRLRRGMALTLRTLVLLLLIAALADVQWVRISRRLSVIYLLDQSLSIPQEQRQVMLEWVNVSIRRHRLGDDRAGVIVFGREPQVEIPPLAESIQLANRIESPLDPEASNLAEALKLAEAVFPEDSARRVVLVSDGNENRGSVLDEARRAVATGLSVDVVTVPTVARGDVAVERIALPGEARQDNPFELRIVLNHDTPDGSTAAGRLIVSIRTDDQPRILSDQPIELPPGKRVFTIRQTLAQPNFYQYEARFVPDDPTRDRWGQNNRATAHTMIRGRGHVLILTERNERPELQPLVKALRNQGLEVTIEDGVPRFSSLVDLQPYDAVVLANVPALDFSNAQIELLVRNTHDLGAGLLMLGGPNSLGAGGWGSTEVERAMPIDFDIQDLKATPTGALMLVIDTSGSMQGENLEMSIAAALAALRVLGERDQVGVVAFDSDARLVVPMQHVGSRALIARQISRLAAGGGTNMLPGMTEGYRGLQRAQAAARHMIVLTDGQTMGEGFEALAARMKAQGITTSTVSVGSGAAVHLMDQIALAGGGKSHAVRDPRAIPRIFITEARRIVRPLIFEQAAGFTPDARPGAPLLAGISTPLPPLTGFVMSTIKANPLVEVAANIPAVGLPENGTLLASWTYGLGKAAVFTSDTGPRWAQAWSEWADYEKFFGQLVRRTLRPVGGGESLVVATDVVDGRVQVVVTSLDDRPEARNFLDLAGSVVDPRRIATPLQLRQTAPGRYVGSFPAPEAGQYLLALGSSDGRTQLRAGVSIGYSSEFRDRGGNVALLEQVASLQPPGGAVGQIIRDPWEVTTSPGAPPLRESSLAINPFRRDLPRIRRTTDAWPSVVWWVALIFFGDVFIRRVALTGDVFPWLVRRLRSLVSRSQTVEHPAYFERLRSRKQEVAQQLESRRGDAGVTDSRLTELPPRDEPPHATSEPESRSAAPPVPSPAAPNEPAESYTDRLLRAKQRVWKDRQPPT